ncbi:hypothetical protein [Arthrobacter alpinus]|uniref:hypothetical protein n=1 Tax=Arthrobacter alpinus TaxID=656366 RepID=UPI0012FEF52B|nr:hypothetical protein [Arthrobacter alpinus]
MDDSQEVLPIWSAQPVPPVWAPNDPATASWTNNPPSPVPAQWTGVSWPKTTTREVHMADMTMKRMIHQAQKLGTAGVRHTLDNPSSVLNTVTRWGRSRWDESKAPQAVAGLIDTMVERARPPRRTQKRAAKALTHAARELRRQSFSPKKKGKVWLVGGLLVTAAAVGTIIIFRTLRARLYTEALGFIENTPAAVEDPVETPAPKDPDPDPL